MYAELATPETHQQAVPFAVILCVYACYIPGLHSLTRMLILQADAPDQAAAKGFLQAVDAEDQATDGLSRGSGVQQLALSPTSMQQAFQVCIVCVATVQLRLQCSKACTSYQHAAGIPGALLMFPLYS